MTATAGTCTQPGCEGTIDGGYCAVCGMAAAPVPVPVAVVARAAAGAPATCTQPGCGGTIDGGITYNLIKGDTIIIPAGKPVWFKEVPGTVSYYVVKITKKPPS